MFLNPSPVPFFLPIFYLYPMTKPVKDIIEHYAMQPHPEGGYYKETYRAAETISSGALPMRFAGARHFSTAIYFLLEQGNFSAFHRIKSDECWHFYAGGALLIYVLNENGSLQTVKLGDDVLKDETFQYVVPAGCWFASAPAQGTEFSFVGCTVSPGFDFEDFELAQKDVLQKQFPQHSELIARLTR